MRFYQADPTLENYWRGVILFGRNAASYKFALAHALYDLQQHKNDLIPLETLAAPFARHLCTHLHHAPKQGTARSSQFLTSCLQFNNDEIDEAHLIEQTMRRGLDCVINAFHKVNHADIDKRFFIDERRASKGIRLTDNFYQLTGATQFHNLVQETDARWRLVEQAWALNVPSQVIGVEYDPEDQLLFSRQGKRRVNITGCRASLNGYQKGRCFYCHRDISLQSGHENLANVDHFIPWMLNATHANLNGVWNLVLACQSCNRGQGGKFARIPSLTLLERLEDRNEYVINSHLPLHEALIEQTGKTFQQRHDFLQTQWQNARNAGLHTWQPTAQGDAIF